MSQENACGAARARRIAEVVAQWQPKHAAGLAAYLARVSAGCANGPRIGRGFSRTRIANEIGVPVTALSVIWRDIRPFLASASGGGVSGAPVERTCWPILAVPGDYRDPASFRAAFDFQIRRNGDTVHSLHRYIVKRGGRLNRATLALWRRGSRTPASEDSLRILALVEEKYGLPRGYFASICPTISARGQRRSRPRFWPGCETSSSPVRPTTAATRWRPCSIGTVCSSRRLAASRSAGDHQPIRLLNC